MFVGRSANRPITAHWRQRGFKLHLRIGVCGNGELLYLYLLFGVRPSRRQCEERYQQFILNMKQALLLFIVLISYEAIGQPYQKLIRPNIYWEQFYYDASTICSTTGGVRVFFEGDTTVNGFSYSKIYEYPPIFPLNQPGPFCAPFGVDTTQSGLNTWYAFREDSIAQKVYIYDFNAVSEYLLYDFNLQPGDTFISSYTTGGNPYIVDSIQTITTYDGVNRRIYFFNHPSFSAPKFIIEGIGSSSGMYLPMLDAIGAGTWLTCVLDHNISLLSYIQYSSFMTCSQMVSVYENVGEFNVSLKPNPSYGLVTIDHSYPKGLRINVYEPYGRLIYSEYSDQMSVLIDLSMYNPGIYFVELAGQDQRICLNKIVIMKD